MTTTDERKKKVLGKGLAPKSFDWTSALKKAKETVQDEHITLRVMGVLDQTYRVIFAREDGPRSPYNTACWFFEKDPAPGVNHIVLGEGLIENTEKNHENMGFYVRAYYLHEAAHSLYTVRDLVGLNKALIASAIPFPVFNLFEDIRIEHIWRKNQDQKFNWLNFETLRDIEDPSSSLMNHILVEGGAQHEAFLELNKMVIAADALTPSDAPKHSKNKEFYDRACRTKTSADLIPIIKDWLIYWKIPSIGGMTAVSLSEMPGTGNSGDGSGDGKGEKEGKDGKDEKPGEGKDDKGKGATGIKGLAGDLATAITLAVEAKEREATKASATPMSDEPAPVVKNWENYDEDGNEVNEITSCEMIYPKGRSCGTVDRALAERLYKKFLPCFKGDKHRSRFRSPSNRISVRAMIRGSERIFKKTEEGNTLGKRKAVLVFDCSGSMSGTPHESGLVLLEIFNKLVKAGKIDLHVILSGGSGSRAMHQVLKFPVKTEVIERVPANGGIEGFDGAIRSNLKLIKDADYVFFYTDADIVDVPLDKAFLHRQGIFTFGSYVGGEHKMEQLRKYFDTFVVRDSIDRLVDAMVAMLSRQKFG